MSVIVAVFNGADRISGCLSSLFAQTFQDFEIVVVDDGSTDDTVDVVRGFGDSRLHLHRLERNSGVSHARNYGAQKARGRYLAILDADDIALPRRLETQVSFLDANLDVAIAGTNFLREDEKGRSQVICFPQEHDGIVKAFCHSCAIGNTTVMIRRQVFLDLHGYPEDYRHGEDYRFFADLLVRHRAANIPETLVVKRETSEGLTFRMGVFQHFHLGLSHRIYALRRLRLGPVAWIKGFAAAGGIVVIRLTGWDRERMRALFSPRRESR